MTQSNSNETPVQAPAGYYAYPPGMPFAGNPNPENEIDLRVLWQKIWAGKWIIGACMLVFGAIAVGIALMLPNIYKSEVLLAPAAQEEGGGMSALAGQFGGLASLAGINLGGSSTDKITIALEVLKSRAFLGEFISKHQLAVPLMAAKGWNAEMQQWQIDPEMYDEATKTWVRKVSPPYKAEPSSLELHELFTKKILSVSRDAKSDLVVVSLQTMSPEMSKQWLDWLIQELNEQMRQRDVDEAQKSIDYLQEQLSKTSLADMQQIFYQLIEQQTKTIMLANVRREYVLKTIDPAAIPELKMKPKRLLIAISGILLGGIVGVLFVFVRRLI